MKLLLILICSFLLTGCLRHVYIKDESDGSIRIQAMKMQGPSFSKQQTPPSYFFWCKSNAEITSVEDMIKIGHGWDDPRRKESLMIIPLSEFRGFVSYNRINNSVEINIDRFDGKEWQPIPQNVTGKAKEM